VEVTPEKAGWDFVHFQVRRLNSEGAWRLTTDESELAIVVLSGRLSVHSDRGEWLNFGERTNVFSGLPFALYLPRYTSLTVSAETNCEFAIALAPTDEDHSPHLITPFDVTTEIRGGDNATRQINSIIPPGFPCQRLVVVEVYTPGGNWSSYPPHKHDVHKTDRNGKVLEADLEEVYYYKFDHPDGLALQRIYTSPESPLQQAGLPIDVALVAHINDVVIVPEGYHPVTAAPGYTTYYLNVLAGSSQTLSSSDDSDYVWMKQNYRSRDPRIPIYEVEHYTIGDRLRKI
nr:5-deoxy-glucuronate isomerase [Ktedonobacteraceae bacterium]